MNAAVAAEKVVEPESARKIQDKQKLVNPIKPENDEVSQKKSNNLQG